MAEIEEWKKQDVWIYFSLKLNLIEIIWRRTKYQ